MTNQADNHRTGLPDWVWAILIVVPAVILFRIIIWWMLIPSYKRMSAVEIDTPRGIKLTQPEHDDLTVIKGIGPKISQAMYDAGVYSYTQFALLKEEKLRKILAEANARLTDISALQTQAKLAASENWDGLTSFQETL